MRDRSAPASLVRRALRVAFSDYVMSGVSVAVGLLLIAGLVGLFLGPFAASIATVGVVVCVPPDRPAPRRGKFPALLPAALLGLPLFHAALLLKGSPAHFGLLLVPATFFAFLAGAWGRRGLPIVVSVMFAIIFPMAIPGRALTELGGALTATAYFALGAGGYVIYATLANAILNPRYRVQVLADVLLALGKLMRTQARQFTGAVTEGEQGERVPLIGRLLRQQAALADQLQAARDVLLESPRTLRRQRLAAMLIGVLDMRDHLLACELDLDTVKAQPGHAPGVEAMREVLEQLAGEIECLADALLTGRAPQPFASHRARLASLYLPLQPPAATPASAAARSCNADVRLSTSRALVPSQLALARGLASRIANLDDEVRHLVALARAESEPDLAAVRTAWQMFVSPTAWSWRPFLAVWRWDAPPLRHAIRAALAIAAGYGASLAVPWAGHSYWILLTIAVVLRGSLAHTIERRNSRVAGTVLGSMLAAAILAAQASHLQLLATVTVSQAIAHAFAIRRYLVTAVAATVLGLVQAHLLAASNPAFAVFERVADTLIGVAIAWAFSYVLPSWERGQLPALVARSMNAQARHARIALGLGQLQAVDNEPELEWRLARREAYDSLSALVQATQRALVEPRAVRPPLEPLGRLLAHSQQLLAQLTAVKTMLLLRRGHLEPGRIVEPMKRADERIGTILTTDAPPPVPSQRPADPEGWSSGSLPDPFENDLTPWLLRRLDLAVDTACRARRDGRQVLDALRDAQGVRTA